MVSPCLFVTTALPYRQQLLRCHRGHLQVGCQPVELVAVLTLRTWLRAFTELCPFVICSLVPTEPLLWCGTSRCLASPALPVVRLPLQTSTCSGHGTCQLSFNANLSSSCQCVSSYVPPTCANQHQSSSDKFRQWLEGASWHVIVRGSGGGGDDGCSGGAGAGGVGVGAGAVARRLHWVAGSVPCGAGCRWFVAWRTLASSLQTFIFLVGPCTASSRIVTRAAGVCGAHPHRRGPPMVRRVVPVLPQAREAFEW